MQKFNVSLMRPAILFLKGQTLFKTNKNRLSVLDDEQIMCSSVF